MFFQRGKSGADNLPVRAKASLTRPDQQGLVVAFEQRLKIEELSNGASFEGNPPPVIADEKQAAIPDGTMPQGRGRVVENRDVHHRAGNALRLPGQSGRDLHASL